MLPSVSPVWRVVPFGWLGIRRGLVGYLGRGGWVGGSKRTSSRVNAVLPKIDHLPAARDHIGAQVRWFRDTRAVARGECSLKI